VTAISVIFASRGRPDSLRAAVGSLLHCADEPGEIEVIVAIDPDDTATAAAAPSLPPQVRLWTAPERFGYERLHDYLNPLAKMASGTWCLWFNDDMRMQTRGWDTVVRRNRPAILWPHANHVHHANIAPAWPRAWTDALGHVTPTTHMDTYLQYLGEALGRHDKIPVEIVHDRADVTGGHDDQTYAEGRKLLGSEGMASSFDPATIRAQVVDDTLRIERLLGGGWGGAPR
jgi:hypothetical protein